MAAGSVQLFLINVAVVPLGLAGVSALIRRRHLTPALRWLAAAIGLGLLTELVSRLLWLRHLPNLALLPAYTVGEFTLLVLLYREALQSARFTRLVPWLLGSFVAYTLLASLTAPDLTRFNSVQRVVESVVVLACVVLFFRKLLNDLTVESLGREPMFWVSLGLLIYFVGNVHIFLFSNYVLTLSKTFNLTVWAIHAVLYMTQSLCYCLALWLPRKN